MFNPQVRRVPKNENELWEVLNEQFQFVRMVREGKAAFTFEIVAYNLLRIPRLLLPAAA